MTSKHILLILLLNLASGGLASELKHSNADRISQQRKQQGKHEKKKLTRKKKRSNLREKYYCTISSQKKILLSLLLLSITTYSVVQNTYHEPRTSTTDISKAVRLPSYVADFRHPGKISAQSGITTKEQVELFRHKLAVEFQSEHPDISAVEANTLLRPKWQSFYRTCNIDAELDNADPVDRARYSLAITHLEKIWAQGFDAIETNKLVSHLQSVHHIMQTGKQGLSLFRRDPVIMKIGTTGLFQIPQMKLMLSSEPKLLTIYEDLIKELEAGPEAGSLTFKPIANLMHQATFDKSSLTMLKKIMKQLGGAGFSTTRIHKREPWDVFMQLVMLTPDHPGQRLFNRLNKFIGSEPSSIERKLKVAFKKAKNHSNPLTAAAYLHMRIVDIHPFADGNGGVARLQAFGLLAQKGITPPMLFKDKEYMNIVQETLKKNNYKLFERYLEKKIAQTEEILTNPKKKAEYEALINDLEECTEDCQERCTIHLEKLGVLEQMVKLEL